MKGRSCWPFMLEALKGIGRDAMVGKSLRQGLRLCGNWL